MATQITLKFFPDKMAERLNGAESLLRSEAEKLAHKAEQSAPAGSTYTVEIVNEPRFQDSIYGVTRPIATARIIGNPIASVDEAENKSMSKAVGG